MLCKTVKTHDIVSIIENAKVASRGVGKSFSLVRGKATVALVTNIN